MGMADILGGVVSTGIAVVIMVSINVKITVFAFVPLLVISIIANLATAWISRLHRASRA